MVRRMFNRISPLPLTPLYWNVSITSPLLYSSLCSLLSYHLLTYPLLSYPILLYLFTLLPVSSLSSPLFSSPTLSSLVPSPPRSYPHLSFLTTLLSPLFSHLSSLTSLLSPLFSHLSSLTSLTVPLFSHRCECRPVRRSASETTPMKRTGSYASYKNRQNGRKTNYRFPYNFIQYNTIVVHDKYLYSTIQYNSSARQIHILLWEMMSLHLNQAYIHHNHLQAIQYSSSARQSSISPWLGNYVTSSTSAPLCWSLHLSYF